MNHRRRHRRTVALAALAMSVTTTSLAVGGAAPGVGAPDAAAASDGFVGVPPARLWETRRANELLTVDGQAQGTGALGAGSTFTLQVTGRGGVPLSGVEAVALNVTAIAPTEPSYVTVYPSGAQRPVASNLNLIPGETIPNMVIVPVSAGGAIDVFNLAGATDVVADVLGWFAAGSDFTGVSPARLFETRAGFTTIDGEQQGVGALGPRTSARMRVAGRAGLPASGVGAVVLNVAAVAPTAPSFVTVYPAGEARPSASNLNTAPGRTLPNMVMARVSDSGEVELYNEAGSVDLAVDLLGWMPAGSTTFVPVGPLRLLETRQTAEGTIDGQASGTGAFGADTTRALQIAGRGGIPASGAGAVAFNVTAVTPSAPSFITVSPGGGARPLASNLNVAPGRTLPNMVVVPLPADGRIDLYNLAGSVDVVVDVLGWFPGAAAAGPNAAVPGALTSPYPTLEHLSLVWSLTGDENRNSEVSLRYRPQGTTTWTTGMPLHRVPPGSGDGGFVWTYRHAGSVFGLQPGTTYEVEARLADPDGGVETRTITATTRTVPTAMAGAPVKAATPGTLGTVLGGAQPGDVVLLGAGTYDGFQIGRSGEPGKPIVVRNGGGAVVNGEIGIFLQHDVHVEGLTVNGRIRFNGSDRVAITGNTINARAGATEGHGIITNLRAENAYIADNIVNGVTVWQESSLGVSGDNLGEGILVTGPGHVIEHNRVRGLRDGISFKEDAESVDQFSIDVLDNDISEAADDGIEADFCRHNCRIMRNRLTNTFVALSSQPSLGGPTYFVRNAVYNVAHVAFKLYRGSSGDVILHNTVVKQGDAFGVYAGRPVTNTFMRNNLFIGGPGGTYAGFGSGDGRVFEARDMVTATVDADHDGFGSTTGTFRGRVGTIAFDSLAALRATTTERNAVEVGLGVFAGGVAFPAAAMTTFAPADLRIAGGSAAADAGVAIPGVNDGFAGTAPDLGVIEAGAPPPAYGPR